MCDSNGLRSASVGPNPTSTGRCGPPHAPEACVLPITPHSRKSGGRESNSPYPQRLRLIRPALSPMSYRPETEKDRVSGFPSKRSLIILYS